MEAGGEFHLGIVYVGTVVQQLQSHTRTELRGQRLLVELASHDGLSRLSEQQAERVFHLTYLTFHFGCLSHHLVVTSLSTLYADGAGTTEFHLQFHHVPGLLGESRHLIHNLLLTVEHQQGIVEVGDIGDDIGLHHHLVVLHGQQLLLGTTLDGKKVAEEVDAPTG